MLSDWKRFGMLSIRYFLKQFHSEKRLNFLRTQVFCSPEHSEVNFSCSFPSYVLPFHLVFFIWEQYTGKTMRIYIERLAHLRSDISDWYDPNRFFYPLFYPDPFYADKYGIEIQLVSA